MSSGMVCDESAPLVMSMTQLLGELNSVFTRAHQNLESHGDAIKQWARNHAENEGALADFESYLDEARSIRDHLDEAN
ncbi:hypothetical protein [Natronoglycomyces albus]|uniref:Uncharacterized protein n=1 Tax=Natronoglycomyces albus TaxID=2811108 RepID=A0A895XP61_9ACTN|nr:hypothetical protein [Natronoglycomyces albus]QSB05169.1 hypothetical protein JQS30_15655 [Natronoglycomyces albus]